jgi:thiol-disulfide isomerase/thioredoxin
MNYKKVTLALSALVLIPITTVFAQDAGGTNTMPKAPAKQSMQSTRREGGTPGGLAAGAVAPDFVSKDTQGKEVHLSSSKNKIIVLDFWATWCGPCKASLPHTQEVAKRFKDKQVVILAVCTSDTREKFEQFVKENQEKYPDIVFTCDPNDRGSAGYAERASNKLYKVRGIPTQFVIGKDGKVAEVLVGYTQGDHRLEDALEKLGVK